MSREEQWNMSMAQDEKVETIKILITDRIAKEGVALLRTELPQAQIDERPGMKPDQLKAIIGEYQALIVRSETQITEDILAAATHLKIVGRARGEAAEPGKAPRRRYVPPPPADHA